MSARQLTARSRTVAVQTTAKATIGAQRRIGGLERQLNGGAFVQVAKMSTTSAVKVRHQKMQSVRVFLLNRKEALNALDLSMIQNITPQLQVWEESNLCKVIVITNPEDHRAFCAGGDVRRVVKLSESPNPVEAAEALKFFELEYQLNHYIGILKKPFISIMNGITMGGGVGISVHAPFRIATEKTLFAMPETGIGLFPDVGGSFFLPRLDGELGTYLGLTGARIKGEEVFMAGIATHYIPSARLPTLLTRLTELETEELDVINNILEEFVADSDLEQWKTWSLGGEIGNAIDRCFKYDTLEEIVEALEKEGSEWANKTLDTLKEMSPTSLKVTLEQLRKGKRQHFRQCFQMEYNLARTFLSTPDFHEGVHAKLEEKRVPNWNPSWVSMGEITPEVVSKFFKAPVIKGGDSPTTTTTHKNTHLPSPQVPFIRDVSYYDYPHRCYNLPTVNDIKRVISGTARRGITNIPPSTYTEVVEFFEQNWGGYDTSVVLGDRLPAHEIGIEGGFGRGKVGLREKVLSLLERYVEEDREGRRLVWRGP